MNRTLDSAADLADNLMLINASRARSEARGEIWRGLLTYSYLLIYFKEAGG